MTGSVRQPSPVVAMNLSGPTSFMHWSIFYVTVANLVLIAVMVVRRAALKALPPGKLLPGRQPACVASWAYVFGVGSLAALGVAIASGFALALGGPDWWHYNPLGHFFNSLHVNFGPMLMRHIVLIPVILVAIVGAHVLLVRVRGVSHPIDAHAADEGGKGGGDGVGGGPSPPPTPRRGAARSAVTTS